VIPDREVFAVCLCYQARPEVQEQVLLVYGLSPLMSNRSKDEGSMGFGCKGIVSYSFTGLPLGEEDTRRVHGVNERIPLASVKEGIRLLMEVLQELSK